MKLIKMLSVVIVLLVITNVTITNRSVDEGMEVAKLTTDINLLQDENTIMKAQIAAAGSLGALSERITAAGYTETPSVTSLKSPVSVASR